jgi:hypothetical protein
MRGRREQIALVTRDADNIASLASGVEEIGSGSGPMSQLELNSKLIREAYAVSKRREFVQGLIGEVDMKILDTGAEDHLNPLAAYSKAMELVKAAAALKKADRKQQEDEDNNTDDDKDSRESMMMGENDSF